MEFDEAQARLRLGQVIRARRIELKISQEQLAFEAGLSATYCSQVECGHKNVTVLVLAKIARVLDTTGAEILARANL